MAQSSNNHATLPTVKVKRRAPEPSQPKNNREYETVKDRYKRPRTKTKGEDPKARDAKTHASPPAEETLDKKRLSFFRSLLRRNDPSLHQGMLRQYNKKNDRPGTGHITNPRQRKVDFKTMSDDIHQYQGQLKGRRSRPKVNRFTLTEGNNRRTPRYLNRLKGLQQKPKIGTYAGNKKVPPPQIQSRRESRKAQIISQSNGPVSYRRPRKKEQHRIHQQTGRQQHQYAGNIKVSKRSQKATEHSFYQGKIRVRTEKHQSRHYKKLSNEIHQFNGLLRVRKADKDMHPSVSYLKSVTKNSHEQKEKYRRRKVSWHRWFKDKSQPKHLKEKPRKPRYDKKESEIWYY